MTPPGRAARTGAGGCPPRELGGAAAFSYDAGRALEESGQALLDASREVTPDAQADPQADARAQGATPVASGDGRNGIPNHRFVLWDKDGVPVEADVYPSCGAQFDSPTYEACRDRFPTVDEFPCVVVTFLGNRSLLGTVYNLATGTFDDCESAERIENLPAWVAAALPDAPYTMTIEY